ncbi:hypothetical protein scyTo_0024383 [Scyliorhinus torazame]|uniref:TIR domain-containing protein n=1 Tax=Scyliorhinus torazame TaxID=75743 RepID=A0A401QDJ5_SCYTO|nr:hypothetical protein [Scyliorhinus torazame]
MLLSTGWAWLGLTTLCLGIVTATAPVGCQVSGSWVDCRGLNLLRVPPELPPNTEVLDLSDNRIGALRNGDLFGLERLRVLHLRYNQISRLEEEALTPSPRLEELDLFNNSLGQLPDRPLRATPQLRRLELSNNLYPSARLGEAFASLRQLRHLSMGGDHVRALRRDDLRPLDGLPLDRFALKTGSALREYQPGALAGLKCREIWTDIMVDREPGLLTAILADLYRTPASHLRFRRLFGFVSYQGGEDLFAGLRESGVRALTFFRGKFTENLLGSLLRNLEGSAVSNLTLEAINFARSATRNETLPSISNLELDYLTFREISNPDVLLFNREFRWFNKVRHLIINGVNFNYIPCSAWSEMKVVEVIDISSNQLQEGYIYNLRCQYRGTLTHLEEFLLSANQIGSLYDMARLTAAWPRLRALDLSDNWIRGCPGPCTWPPPLEVLSLRRNPLTDGIFACLPTSLRRLDLSHGQLERLDPRYFARASNLTQLTLSGNRLKFIPADWRGASLQSLALDGNSFGVISRGTFSRMPLLVDLQAGNNPYHCTCDLYRFVQETRAGGTLRLLGWPSQYVCYHPERLLDTNLADFAPGRLECDVGLVVAVSMATAALAAMAAMLLCWRYNVPWYLGATWQIVRAKYRARAPERAGGYAYHAFVSYSYGDAGWVREQLVRRLEGCDPPYRVCFHERDFTPGKWIIDNIIENIESSRKVIFVLSRGFVDSEWCNYELYFAHTRAIVRSFQDVVLVLREAIDPGSLPSKFCKLRKMLDTQTYLEWPSEPSRQPFFWAQLRGVLGRVDPQAPGSGPSAPPEAPEGDTG